MLRSLRTLSRTMPDEYMTKRIPPSTKRAVLDKAVEYLLRTDVFEDLDKLIVDTPLDLLPNTPLDVLPEFPPDMFPDPPLDPMLDFLTGSPPDAVSDDLKNFAAGLAT
jgi:hypothetical protein